MPRYARNAVILGKIESTYATDPTPTGVANSILVSNLSVNPLNANNVSRDLIRPYMGGSEQLVGTASVEISFDVEWQSSGSMTAPTVPAWGPLMRACGFAEVGTAGSRVEYTPVSTGFESVAFYYNDDGVRHKILGARGNVTLKAMIGERPLLSFKFIGLDGGVATASESGVAYAAWKAPAVITDTNTGDLKLGCTYSAGTLSGGTVYTSRGLEIDMGNKVEFIPFLSGQDRVEITGRDPVAKFMLDLTAANEVTFMSTVKANTLQALGFDHGSSTGYIMKAFAPAMQLINPRKEDVQGLRLLGFDGRLLPSSGNDELRVVTM